MLRRDNVGLDTQVLPSLEKRCSQSFQFSKSMVRRKPREERKDEVVACSMEDTPVLIVASIIESRNSLPVSLYSLPEGIVGDRGTGAERECHNGSINLGVCLDSVGGHDTVCTSATTAEGPEEVSVLVLVGSEELTVCSYDVDAENLCRVSVSSSLCQWKVLT